MKSKWHFPFLAVVVAMGLAACGTSPAVAPTQESQELQKVRLGVGFIPNVQFAPLYVAQDRGFYADEGLEVEIEYGNENDFVTLAAQGKREFAIASGDQVILARAQGLPITYVMKWYQRYPVALAAPASKGIVQPDDLAGKKVGLPLFGTSLIGWKALVYATNIDETAVTVEDIGFTQVASIQQDVVDAAIVYIANEPNQLRSEGLEVNVIEISDYIDLVSNGLVTGEQLIDENPDLVERMVRATLRGVTYAIDHPDEAFAIAREVIPEITDETVPVQKKVLEASIELWKSERPGLSSEQAWRDSVDFMVETGLVDQPVEVGQLYTNQFVETP